MFLKKILRSFLFIVFVRNLLRKKNKQLKQKNLEIKNLRRELFYLRHRVAVAEQQSKGIQPHGRTARAGL